MRPPSARCATACAGKIDELYNDGSAFKLTCRDEQGRVITVIADNYFGYCKKEVKTQIGLSANLFGLSEEEHAGGAQVHASYNLSRTFHPQRILRIKILPSPTILSVMANHS